MSSGGRTVSGGKTALHVLGSVVGVSLSEALVDV